jgi:hypothetical protein
MLKLVAWILDRSESPGGRVLLMLFAVAAFFAVMSLFR